MLNYRCVNMSVKRILYVGVMLVTLIAGVQQQLIGQSLSQRGKDFWLLKPYSISGSFVVFDLSTAQESATVTITAVSESNTWERTYQVPPNSTLVSESVPAWIQTELAGSYSSRYIHVHSSAPIACYSHFYGDVYSGGTMLLSEETWGYSYTVVTSPNDHNSFVCVLASQDNTKVEIDPITNTDDGHIAGSPYTVVLNKGQSYRVMSPLYRTEVTGTRFKSVPNSDGVCKTMTIFYGSMGTPVCNDSYSSDLLIQQMPPRETWGSKYLTTPFSSSVSAKLNNGAFFRVMVKDPTTVVKLNGVVLTNLVNNLFYEFDSPTADYIEADKPVMVAQFMKSQDCNASGIGDPEVIVLSPLEQAVKRVDFHNSYMLTIEINYLSLTIPTSGLNSLTINGSNKFSYTYPHPAKPGYTVVVNRWVASDEALTVKSDSAFTAITYGLGPHESYGFNLIPLQSLVGLVRLQEKGEVVLKESICNGSSFKPVLKTEFLPLKIEWHLKNIAGLSPNDQDIVLQNPVPDSSFIENGRLYNIYGLPQYYTFKNRGIYTFAVTITAPAVENCSNTQTFTGYLESKAVPVADFSSVNKGCLPFDISFTAGAKGDTSTLIGWKWDFGDAESAIAAPAYHATVTGNKDVYLQVQSANGCFADTTKTISITEAIRPVAAFQLPGLVCLPYGAARFTNQSTYTGTSGALTYLWNFDDGAIASDKDVTHYYTDDRSYDVSLIVAAPDGCSDTVIQKMSAFSVRPKAGFTMSADAICALDTVFFTDQSVTASGTSITAWKWQLDGKTTATAPQTRKIYTSPGRYTITLYVTNNEGCNSDTAEKLLEVYDVPRVDAGSDKLLIQGAAVRLQGSVSVTGNVQIQWSPAGTLIDANTVTPLASPKQDQWYHLSAVTGGGCSANDSVLVKVLPALVVPNAFTPNGDGNNDVWDIPGLNSYQACTVQVFNRWGQKVFESRGYAAPWNGTQSGGGGALPAGTYYYIINPGQGVTRLTGTLTLLR